jgi:8-oxo-dGTP diphosphatase
VPLPIRKAALAVLSEGRIMMVRSAHNPEVFYTVGGKPKGSESDLECLIREVEEEVGCALEQGSIVFLREFRSAAHGSDRQLVLRLYRAELIGEPRPCNEVVEVGYFDSSVDPRHLTQSANDQIFPWLKAAGFIN